MRPKKPLANTVLLESAVLDALEPGDHLLGWQDGTSLRYCHHFEEREIDQLIEALPAGTVRPFERYSADGRAGNLNRYVLLRRTPGSEPRHESLSMGQTHIRTPEKLRTRRAP